MFLLNNKFHLTILIIKNIKEMKIVKKIYEIMLCNTVLHKLLQQNLKFKINTAYKLYKLKNQFDEIEQLVNERWKLLFGEYYNIENLSDEQIVIYNLTVESEIEIDTFDLDIETILTDCEVQISLKDIETIDKFFNKNNVNITK